MKKLTAGIFTALLGLVTVNAANAAIPSTTYVDTKITTAQTAAEDYADAQDVVLKSDIQTAYEAADATLKSGYETADAALKSAYEAADTALDGRVDTLETKVGSGTMTVSGTAQTDVIAAINALDTKTEGIASNENLKALENTVKTHTTQITDLQTADTTNLQEAKDYADSLATNYDAAGAAATAETNAKAYANSLASNYDVAGSAADALADAKAYADQAEADAVASAKSYANTELAKKVDKEGHTASQVVITDSTGAIATAAQIANTQVSGLGDLATKSTIADADVATDAAIAQSKIAGLEDALANTTPKVTAKGEAGTYVLTAIVSDSGATSYQWEQISRPTTGDEG